MIQRCLSILAALSLVGVAACGDDGATTSPTRSTYTRVDPAAVRARISQTVPQLVDGADAAAAASTSAALSAIAQGVHDLPTIAGVASSGAAASRGGSALAPASERSADRAAASLRARSIEEVVAPLGAAIALYKGGLRMPVRPPMTRSADGDSAPQDPATSRGAQLAAYLNEHVFTDANQHDGRFPLPAELVCGDTPTIDDGCLARAAAADLQLGATLRGKDGLDLAVLVGAAHEPAITISLAPKQAQLSIDLAALEPALDAFLADGSVTPTSPIDATGIIDADLALWGPNDLTVTVAIDAPIHVGFAGVVVDVAAAQPAFSLHLDGPDHALVAATTLDEMSVRLPASADGKTPGKLLDVPALRFAATAKVGQPLLIQALSLGDRTTQLLVDGKPAFSLDLNANDGRKVDLSIDTEADTGAVVVEAAPRLDVAIAIDWAALGAEAPAVQIKRVVLDAVGGTLGAIRTITVGDQSETEVVGGSLTIETDPAGAGSVIAAGACVGADFTSTACTLDAN